MSKNSNKDLKKVLVDKEVKMSEKEESLVEPPKEEVLEETVEVISEETDISEKEEVSVSESTEVENSVVEAESDEEIILDKEDDEDIFIDDEEDFTEKLSEEDESFLEDSFQDDDVIEPEKLTIKVSKKDNLDEVEVESSEDDVAEEEMDDDELFLLSKDKLKYKDDEMTIIQQMNNIVTWEVDGLYNKNGKLNSKRTLKSEPPIFIISSSTGDTAEFLVTKEMSFNLYKTFETVYKGYFGLDNRGDKFSFSESFEKFKKWAEKHPVKLGFITVIIIFIIVMLIIGGSY